jgi:exosortase A-associated hydrolase 1
MAASGTPIEVSGYQVNGQLAREMDALKLPDASGVRAPRVFWCEVLPAADSNVPRANTKVVEAWQGGGVAVTFEKVVGPSFWQVHEREVAPDLVTATTNYLQNQAPGSAPLRATPAVNEASKTASRAISHPLTETPITAATREYPVLFNCAGDELAGMIHRGKPGAKRGVVIVVAGGPQYRAGAHRQFVSLARKLATRCGYPVLRFDLRGMGDSAGIHRGFQQSDADIRAAIDALLKYEPGLESVILLGECESASGILFYAYRDERAQGVVLVNPWVRTEGGRAEVIMKHYYWSRLTSKDFWRKVVGGKFNPIESLGGFFTPVRDYLRGRKLRKVTASDGADIANLPLPVKTAAGLRRFRGKVLILMSGNDYIAREFDEVIRSSQAWVGLLDDPRVLRRDLEGADHTFSREQWKRQASDWVCEWAASW